MALMRAQLRQFTAADLDEAGRLLSARHRRHREHQPLLARRFEDAEAATAQVAAIWRSDGASGSVAITGGRVVGYLLGSVKPSPVWGPNVWVEAAGQAVHGDAEVMRDLYGAAAARWVEEGRTAHNVLVPASDRGLAAAWFRLGFGHQHTHAVRLPQHEKVAPRDGVRIRRAARADIPVLARLELELPRHQVPRQHRADPPRQRGLPRLRSRPARGSRSRCGAGPRRDGARLVRDGWLRRRSHGLAADQPAVLSGLAGPWLRGHVLASAPPGWLLSRDGLRQHPGGPVGVLGTHVEVSDQPDGAGTECGDQDSVGP